MGLTVIVNVFDVPGHSVVTGVTVMVAICGILVVFVTAKELISPTPVDAKPMAELELVH